MINPAATKLNCCFCRIAYSDRGIVFQWVSSRSKDVLGISARALRSDAQTFLALMPEADSAAFLFQIHAAALQQEDWCWNGFLALPARGRRAIEIEAQLEESEPETDTVIWTAAIRPIAATHQPSIELAPSTNSQPDDLSDFAIVNRALIEALPDLLFHVHADGTLLKVIAQGNYKPKEPYHINAGANIRDFLPPDLASKRFAMIQQALREQKLQVYEQIISIDGQENHEEVRIIPCTSETVLVIVRDVTARWHAETKLRVLQQGLEQQVAEKTQQYRQALLQLKQEIGERQIIERQLRENNILMESVINGTSDVIFVKDIHGNYILCNQPLLDLLDLPSSMVLNYDDIHIFPLATARRLKRIDREVIRLGQSRTYEETMPKGGVPRSYLTTKSPYRNAQGKVIGVIGISRDISDRVQAEQQLASQYQLTAFRAEIDSAITQSASLQVILTRCTQAVVNHFDATFARIWTLSEDGTTLELQASSGLYTHIDGGHARIPVGQFKIGRIAQSRQPHLTNNVQSDPRVSDPEWARREGMIAFAGYPLQLDGELLGVVAMFARQPLTEKVLQSLEMAAVEISLGIKRKQAEADLQAQTHRLQETLRELRRTQARAVQSEKMSSLGLLVAGVAHEINNPVNFIYGNLAFAEEYSEQILHLLKLYEENYPSPASEIIHAREEFDIEFVSKDLPRLMNSMKIGADRIKNIVNSLRVFTRADEVEAKIVDIHGGLDSSLMILQNRIKEKSVMRSGIVLARSEIQIKKEYELTSLVECYPGELNQVFMNILANAIDALDDAWTIQQDQSVDDVHPQTPMLQIRTELQEDGFVRICIADNGTGIPEDVLNSLYDPFFTTKPMGKGTGMGLAISYQIIVERHHGSLDVRSEPGRGTEFEICIPRSLPREKR